jgi:hypothetical protein
VTSGIARDPIVTRCSIWVHFVPRYDDLHIFTAGFLEIMFRGHEYCDSFLMFSSLSYRSVPSSSEAPERIGVRVLPLKEFTFSFQSLTFTLNCFDCAVSRLKPIVAGKCEICFDSFRMTANNRFLDHQEPLFGIESTAIEIISDRYFVSSVVVRDSFE